MRNIAICMLWNVFVWGGAHLLVRDGATPWVYLVAVCATARPNDLEVD